MGSAIYSVLPLYNAAFPEVCMNDVLCVVLSTAPDRETAERIGEALLRERLAACVQYEAVRSQYWWQGTLCTDDEVRLVIKTRRALFDAVEAAILRLHPYDCPQVLCLAVDAVNAGYQAWATAASANPAV